MILSKAEYKQTALSNFFSVSLYAIPFVAGAPYPKQALAVNP